MSKIDQLFQQLKADQKKAFMPFITAGDPSLAVTSELIKAFDAQGCHICEVGIPYSDPIADGPVIQASYTRALGNKITVDSILSMLGKTSPEVNLPLVTMVSYAIIFRRGVEQYIDRAMQSGVSGVIVPDLPVEEAEGLSQVCRSRDFSLIQLVTPTTSRERAKRILETSTGFVYYVSVAGITGERTALPPDIIANVSWLREQGDVPVCIGFGISEPEHVKALAPHSDGLIVGSSIVRRIATSENDQQVVVDVKKYVDEMLQAFDA
ncbi:MAG: tryptophan synthase subunit alpha [Planctomycetota bacterium]|nr:tryptophan synthase subunit alpha [Planctomycetota bacterium]